MCWPAGPFTRILEQTLSVQIFLSLFHASLVQKVCGPSPEQAPALLTPAALLYVHLELPWFVLLPSPPPLPLQSSPQPPGIFPQGGVSVADRELCPWPEAWGHPVQLPETGRMAGGVDVKATPLPGAITGSTSALPVMTTLKESISWPNASMSASVPLSLPSCRLSPASAGVPSATANPAFYLHSLSPQPARQHILYQRSKHTPKPAK